MSTKGQNMICAVCDGRASGYHFTVMSCEACKSFFRKYALKPEDYFKCYLGGNCKIELNYRKQCKKCRLDKCLSVGMTSDLIFSETQRKLRKILIEENRKKKHKIQADSTTAETNVLSNTCSALEPIYHKTNACRDRDKYQSSSVISIVRPITAYGITFNELEGNKFVELINAVKYLDILSTSSVQVFVGDIYEAMRVMTAQSNTYIKNTVKLCKHLNAFTSVCESDQLVLIKYSVLEIRILHMILNFNFDKQYWRLKSENDDTYIIQMDFFKQLPQHGIYYDYYNFYQYMGSEWESDTCLLDLLAAIILFNPTRPELNHPDTVKYQQNIYLYLLKRYLQIKYRSDTEWCDKYIGLINNLRHLRAINSKIAVISKKNDFFPPLLKEICDRKE